MIRALYTLLWRLALAPAWAWWAWRTRRDGGAAERGRWRERLGLLEVPAEAQDGLLLHAASIGEGVAATALIEALRRRRPELRLLVTSTSFTGAERLRHALGGQVQQAFLPFDTPGAMARLLDRARPRVVVLLETELWPNLLAAARERAIPVVLANARLSPGSARGYARFAALARPMLKGLHQVLAQSPAIARRFRALGVPPERIVVAGNLKADVTVPPTAQAGEWRQVLGPRPVLVAASTHAGEDEALLAAWPAVRASVPEALLVLVPRHPQRFEAVAQLIVQQGHALHRRSLGAMPGPSDAVWLGDTLGEVAAWMALADLAFVGGSLVPHGGHSPLEAMVQGRAVCSGRAVHNFAEAYRALDRSGGVAWLDSAAPEALAAVLSPLLADSARRQLLGRAGRRVYEAGAGAASRSADALVALLEQGPGAVSRQDDGRLARWIDTGYAPPLPAEPFDDETWRAQGRWQAVPSGRGSAGFIGHGPDGLVLRHFRRGGLAARWSRDLFLAGRPEHSRAMREFALLARLRAAGLPVPRPVAAQMRRVGALLYRADLIVERLPRARSLGARLREGEALPPACWRALGAALARLHGAGVDHVDLNADNLLIDVDGGVWIIDFDRCRQRSTTGHRQRNLQRLARSLHKLQRQQPGIHFGPVEWAALESGYQGLAR